jgi:hypothetical protein
MFEDFARENFNSILNDKNIYWFFIDLGLFSFFFEINVLLFMLFSLNVFENKKAFQKCFLKYFYSKIVWFETGNVRFVGLFW